MSIFGSMRTAVSGMSAQANKLSSVSDNIANSSTTGYKASSTSFSSLVLPSTAGNYNSGGVATTTSYAISEQGGLTYTTSSTDLAIQGDGFFVVTDAAGTPYLTRAGDFSPDANGNLVNAAGYTLMGYSYDSGSPSVVVNGFDGLVPINTETQGLTAVASTTASFSGNLNSNATVATGNLPADNTAPVTDDTEKTSLIAYDTQGNKVQYDFYYTKTSTSPDPDTWDVSVYKAADAATGGTSSFPYSSAAVGSGTLEFDSSGKLVSGGDLQIQDTTAVNGEQDIDVDLSGFSQLASAFAATGDADGQAPSAVSKVTIGTDGTVTAQYADGTSKPLYRIPLANVASPDSLTVLSGNVYSANGASGVTVTGFPSSSGLGYIQSGALEESNVDLAGELTTMIEAQKSYTANSKVFQTGSDLMDVLVNLVR